MLELQGLEQTDSENFTIPGNVLLGTKNKISPLGLGV